jgi:hypothetical protein
MVTLIDILDSKFVATITGVLIGIILTIWRDKRKKQQEDRLTYLGWLNGLSAEIEHINKCIQEISGYFQVMQPGGICTKRNKIRDVGSYGAFLLPFLMSLPMHSENQRPQSCP